MTNSCTLEDGAIEKSLATGVRQALPSRSCITRSLACFALVLAAPLLLEGGPSSPPVGISSSAILRRADARRCNWRRRRRRTSLASICAAPALLATGPTGHPIGEPSIAIVWQRCHSRHSRRWCCRRTAPAAMCATPGPLANGPPRHQAMVAIQVVSVAVIRQ